MTEIRTPIRPTLPFAALALAIGLTLPAFAGETIERSIPVNPDVEVDIDILSGRIDITGWDRDVVEIRAVVGADAGYLEIDVDDRDSVSIEIDLPKGKYNKRHDLSVELELSVPYDAEIDIETLSADITLDDLRGELDAESMSGTIEIAGTPRAVDAETISGNVRFRGTTQELDIESVSGNIEIEGAERDVKVTTVNGHIRLVAGTLKKCNLESVSGRVDFEGALDTHADVDIAVHSSNVLLSLPSTTSAEFEIDTFSGDIENDFGPAAERESEWMTAKTLDFTIGEGRGSVKIESFSGDVKLAKR